MRFFGFIAVAIGMIMLFVSCGMETSVATISGARVNNIGLMQQQTMLGVVGLGLMLIGTIMWIAGRRKPEVVQQVQADFHRYSPEELKDLDVLLADEGWTGISLKGEDPKVIHSVDPSSSAAEAGILPGDRLVQIDGKFVGNDLRENIINLAGPPGTPVRLMIRRADSGMQVEVQRR